MSKQGKLDRLSSLPDDILSHILTLIPMEAAVQTSVLSTRWRYLFASMSRLDFDDTFLTTTNVRSLEKFVYRLLRFPNQGSLECFRLTYITMAYHDCLCHLIYFALRRGVKEINLLLFGLDHIDEIVTPLFTCQSLVTLKLYSDRLVIPVPSTICLPNLKNLHFRHLIFTDSISRLISSCCVLEDLVLDVSACAFDNTSEINIQSLSLKTLVLNYSIMRFLGFDYAVVINAPSVVHFQYNGYIAKDYTISNMTSLIKAEIRILCFDDVDREQSVIHFLQGICNVRSLYLSIDDFEGTLFPARIDPVLAFHNLVELKIHDRRNHWIRTRLVEFLHCVPNLKTLILDLAVRQRTFMFPPEVPSCLSSHLKEITISNFRGEQHVFEMISYFLDNGMVLEKLILRIETHDLSYPSLTQLTILKKLLSLPRSSSTCQVLTF